MGALRSGGVGVRRICWEPLRLKAVAVALRWEWELLRLQAALVVFALYVGLCGSVLMHVHAATVGVCAT